jgi:hypothetical protein
MSPSRRHRSFTPTSSPKNEKGHDAATVEEFDRERLGVASKE